ncbi:hypothetical protein PhiCh1p33 [Natrialba phage PhiCh1]|uniref:Virus protein phiCh1-VP32 n=2 Tax=root TaxID=1 RepID=D3T2H9_NATMM|nr:hypothetical protein [Natrialba magadii]NP_665950.1 hypothetical protein PhiCh1p33 [Natrialba phage PhiCh1]YP_010078060.1 uncharacterized protein KMC42_gp30 [Natrialba phage PhiCh1]AAM88706.1 unknown [Natrialba phage PhiCh1]ADD07788.1 virus protein phiCh1-VP32 [Natrialba magadii ATCC 43099]ELY23035.1 hypothetical protein C500_21265 [Natrialba magadii ATCC 43099]QBJ01211.1 uncharacterized protein PhiCh1_145 [Natrialba phage PhiCh1]
MTSVTASETVSLADNVQVDLYDADELANRIPGWEAMTDRERLGALEDVDPVGEFSEHNVTTLEYRTHLAELLNPDVDVDPVEATHLAFGDDDTPPDEDDEELEGENYRTELSDIIQEVERYRTITLLGSDDAVGDELIESGLVTAADPGDAGDMLVNRVILDDDRLRPKTTDHAVRIRVDISYHDVADETVVSS